MSNPLAAAIVLNLKRFENEELAALNNAVQLSGKVHSRNLAFEKCKELSLVDENGNLCDVEAMRTACAYEVNSRVRAGTFA